MGCAFNVETFWVLRLHIWTINGLHFSFFSFDLWFFCCFFDESNLFTEINLYFLNWIPPKISNHISCPEVCLFLTVFFLVCLFLTVLLAFSTLLNCLIDPKNDRLFYIKFFQHKIKLHRFNKLLKRIFLHIHYKWTTMKLTILYAVFPAAFTKEDVLHNNLLTIIKNEQKKLRFNTIILSLHIQCIVASWIS